MNKATKSQKTDNKTAKIAGILVLLAVVILVILLLLRGCGSKGAELPAQPETARAFPTIPPPWSVAGMRPTWIRSSRV